MKIIQFLNRSAKTWLLGCALIAFGWVHAADPSMSEVYKAAESGNFSQAEAMMKQVLSDHPNSAKAHFVHAEILAKEGRLAAAKDELQIADKLAPGLPFAKQEAVQSLEARLSAPAPLPAQTSGNTYQNTHPSSSGSSLLPWVLGFAALAFILFIVRMMTRPREIYSPMPGYGGNPGGLQPSGYGPTPMGGPGMMGGGGSSMGSGILGGLATGAAVGAGMVAGEALMHNMLGDHHNGSNPMPGQGFQDNGFQPTPSSNYDMGGSNFGVNDSSSWDDSSSSGGGSDDW